MDIGVTSYVNPLTIVIATISVTALGAIYHTVWRYRSAIAGCTVGTMIDDRNTTEDSKGVIFIHLASLRAL